MSIDTADSLAGMLLELNTTRGDLPRFQELNVALVSFEHNIAPRARFQLASELLTHRDLQVRFYGASLLQSVGRDIPDPASYRQGFLHLLHNCGQQDVSLLVVRKLCTAIAELYCSSRGWTRCLREFYYLCLGGTQETLSWSTITASVNLGSLQAGLILVDAITAETSKRYLQSVPDDSVDAAYLQTVCDSLGFLETILSHSDLADLTESPLAIFEGLLLHPLVVADSDTDIEKALVDTFVRSLDMLGTGTAKQIHDVSVLVSTALDKRSSLISPGIWHSLLQYTGDLNHGPLKELGQPRDGYVERASSLLLPSQQLVYSVAFRGLDTGGLFSSLEDPNWMRILEALAHELDCDFDDDTVSFALQLLGFWTEFVDSAMYVADEGNLAATSLSSIRAILQAMVLFAIPHFCTRSQSQSTEPSTESDELSPLQADIRELLCAIYPFLQSFHSAQTGADSVSILPLPDGVPNPLLSLLLDTPSPTASKLDRLAAFNALADYAARNESNDAAIAYALDNFVLNQNHIDLSGSSQTLRFLGSYHPYFNRKPDSLPLALQHIYTELPKGGQTSLQAAVTLHEICLNCRNHLIGYTETLTSQYAQGRASWSQAAGVKSNLVSALAGLAYTTDQQLDMLRNTRTVVSFIISDVDFLSRACESIPIIRDEHVQFGVELLACIARMPSAMERNLNLPGAVIDLEADDDTDAGVNGVQSRFLQEESQLRDQLTSCMSRLLQIPGMGQSELVLQKLCTTLEVTNNCSIPAIFRFSPSLHVEALQACLTQNKCSDLAMSMFEQLLFSYGSPRNHLIDQEAFQALGFVCDYISWQSIHDSDPDVLTNAIQLVATFVRLYPDIVAAQIDKVRPLLQSSLDLIQRPNHLPKVAACKLWTELISDRTALTQSHLDGEWILGSLCLALCTALESTAMARDLEPLTAVICALVKVGTPAQRVFDSVVSQTKIQDGKDHYGWGRFVRQIFALRGDAGPTKPVVTRFWTLCQNSSSGRGGTSQEVVDDEDDLEVIDIMPLGD